MDHYWEIVFKHLQAVFSKQAFFVH